MIDPKDFKHKYTIVKVEFTFTKDEMMRISKYYTKKELKQILYAGGNGELGSLLENRESMDYNRDD